MVTLFSKCSDISFICRLVYVLTLLLVIEHDQPTGITRCPAATNDAELKPPAIHPPSRRPVHSSVPPSLDP
jgi:hypothetical protein